jgi:hypothetical protein
VDFGMMAADPAHVAGQGGWWISTGGNASLEC